MYGLPLSYCTFSLHDGILIDDITELTYDFEYFYMGFCSVEDEIQTEIDKIILWLSNDGHIAFLKLAALWL